MMVNNLDNYYDIKKLIWKRDNILKVLEIKVLILIVVDVKFNMEKFIILRFY